MFLYYFIMNDYHRPSHIFGKRCSERLIWNDAADFHTNRSYQRKPEIADHFDLTKAYYQMIPSHFFGFIKAYLLDIPGKIKRCRIWFQSVPIWKENLSTSFRPGIVNIFISIVHFYTFFNVKFLLSLKSAECISPKPNSRAEKSRFKCLK